MKQPTRSLVRRSSSSIRATALGPRSLAANVAKGVILDVAERRGHGGESRAAAAGAATGALVGSFLGPLGALVGGGVGGLIGFHVGGRRR
jgi:uncharacterized protein YqgC (DUF456 family)